MTSRYGATPCRLVRKNRAFAFAGERGAVRVKMRGVILLFSAVALVFWRFVLNPIETVAPRDVPASTSTQSPFEEAAQRKEKVFGPKRDEPLPVQEDAGFALFDQVSLGGCLLLPTGLSFPRILIPLVGQSDHW